MRTRLFGAAATALWVTGVVIAAVISKPATVYTKFCGHPAAQSSDPSVRWSPMTLDELYSVGGPLPIPDNPGNNTNDTLVSVLNISATNTITDLNVRIVISHPWVRDLYISLTGPDDTVETVLLNWLPQDGADTLDGWFDDEAGISIMNPEAPLAGIWRPLDALDGFDGRSAQGDWTLRVWDRFRLDSGYVALWGIDVNPVESFRGVVKNSYTRAPIKDVRISLPDSGFSTQTNADGQFSFLSIPAGSYTVQFSKEQYDTLTVAGVVITGGSTAVLDTILATVSNYYEFASTEDPVAIPDSGSGSASQTFRVRGPAGVIADLDVTANITHTWVSDLTVFLKSPSGDSIRLAQRVGGNGDDFVDCRFDDEATQPISGGAAPFTGRFAPQEPLSAFDTLSVSGTWALTVIDSASGDIGTIESFILHISVDALAVDLRGDAVPGDFTFYGNYPNPFNGTTVFRFDLARRGRIGLDLFNTLGQHVARVADDMREAGAHQVAFDAGYLPSGLYWARLTNGQASQIKKIVLLK